MQDKSQNKTAKKTKPNPGAKTALEGTADLSIGCTNLCGDCVDCPGVSQERTLGYLRDLTATVGFASLSSTFATTGIPTEARAVLLKAALDLPEDPYIGSPYYRRGFGLFLYFRGQVIPLPGVKLDALTSDIEVSGFDIGSANEDNVGERVFYNLPDAITDNPAMRRMIELAVKLDPCDPRAKEIMIIQVFVQAALVDDVHLSMQAAPPDNPHNDKCRFKANFLVGRHNVDGGSTYMLPRAYSNKPFDDVARSAVLAQIDLEEPGQGYCFLDDMPGESDIRAANCHYAETITKGTECNSGYRVVTTITPAPLLPTGGTKLEVDEAKKRFASNTTALLELPKIVAKLSRDERARLTELFS